MKSPIFFRNLLLSIVSGIITSGSLFLASNSTHAEESGITNLERLSRYQTISLHLAAQSEEELVSILDQAHTLETGTGGKVSSIEIKGFPVFVKKICLADLEKQNFTSTSNLFHLPTFYQYGVGSKGFGARRELLSHEMTTQWVLQGETSQFPIMYHYRILPRSVNDLPKLDQLEKLDAQVKYWEGSQAVRERIEACHLSSSDIVIFMEFFPKTVYQWLSEQMLGGESSALLAVQLMEKEFKSAIEFMHSKEFLHFDAHAWNVLTDGQHLYLADFGLAISNQFDLSFEEREFFQKHRNYDRYYLATQFFYSILGATLSPDDRLAVYQNGSTANKVMAELPQAIALITIPYQALATRMNQFFQTLVEDKNTEYPEQELSDLFEQTIK